MGAKTSLIPQMDFLSFSPIPRSNAPTRLTGEKNTRVFECVAKSGLTGVTVLEAAEQLDLEAADIGPRFSELHSLHLIRKTDSRRKGRVVWIIFNVGSKS